MKKRKPARATIRTKDRGAGFFGGLDHAGTAKGALARPFVALPPAAHPEPAACALNSPHHNQDEDNQQDKAKSAARAIAPAGAMRPGWQGANQQQDQQDEKNGSNGHKFPHFMEQDVPWLSVDDAANKATCAPIFDNTKRELRF